VVFWFLPPKMATGKPKIESERKIRRL